jgi:hypothetical protein
MNDGPVAQFDLEHPAHNKVDLIQIPPSPP